jgi:hypothetical protein
MGHHVGSMFSLISKLNPFCLLHYSVDHIGFLVSINSSSQLYFLLDGWDLPST